MEFGTRKKMIEFFSAAEKDYDVNTWTYKDIHLWPYIKQYLFFKEVSNHKENKNDNVALVKIFHTTSLLNFIKNFFFGGRKSSSYGMMEHFRHKEHESGILINKFYNDLIKEEKLKPLIIDHSAKGNFYRSEIDQKTNTLFSFESKLLVLLVRNLFFSKKEIASLKNNKDFTKFINAYNARFSTIDKKEISKSFYQVYLSSRLYKRLFKTQKIQKVYVLGYYLSDMYSMVIAGNELQLDTYDIQHGSQGELHVAYNDFSKVPKRGYSLLPKYFLCWNEQSASAINSWAEKTNHHKAIFYGNPWENYNINNGFKYDNLPSDIFLVTLQPIGDNLVEPHLLDVISETKDKYNWFLRLHPRQLHLKSDLNKLLVEYDLSGFVNVEDAINLPLPKLLQNTRIHFSKFSGSIEEAAAHNVMSLIMDYIGVHSYKYIIEKGLAHPCTKKSKDELIRCINSIKNV